MMELGMNKPKKAIKNGTLIDGTGKTPLENSVVVIDGSKITAVGKVGEVQIPSDAQIIDAAGKVVMPGLMDLHVHLGNVEGASTAETLLDLFKASPFLLLLFAVKHSRELLEAGFTTVRDLGMINFMSADAFWAAKPLVCLRTAIERGLVPGPRIVVAGPFCMSAGHFDMSASRYENLRAPPNGPFEVRKRVRELAREHVDLIKIASGGGTAGEGEEIWWRNYTIDELRAIVDEAHALGKKVAAHAYTADTVKNALEAGVDTIEHGSFLDDEAIQMLVEKKAFLVPTLTTYHITEKADYMRRKKEEVKKAVAANFRKAHEAGVRIAAGTDLFLQEHPDPMYGDNAYELELMVRYGMSEMEAVMSATKSAAEALGLEKEIGTIEEGKSADIIILQGDPVKDIKILQKRENIRKVVKNGRIELDRDSPARLP
jgi:imidazolonepropionase-like amidohydrolase